MMKQAEARSAILPAAALAALLALTALLGPGALAQEAGAPAAAEADLDSGAAEESAVVREHREAVDEAVDRALAYLAAQQRPDGTFPGNMRQNTAVVSLCVMAFLAKGHTPGLGPYGEAIDRGIDFVLASQRDNGMLVGENRSHGPMYSHTISTLMLSEVSGMVDPERQARIDEVLPEALRLILAAQQVDKPQSHRGGWRYQPNSRDSDISCTGWPLMALRSARNNGAAVPAEAVEGGIRFVMNCRTSDGGFAYQPGQGPGPARTGTALLALELCGHHRSEEATAAADWILKHLPRRHTDAFFYYGLYYCAQGMYQIGGKRWDAYARYMYDMMLKLQRQDGSFPPGSSHEANAGVCYSTAMTVLALSVTYCQLPIYQR